MALPDRRVTARFEIIGELWGSVQAHESMRICNLAPGGALVESDVPLPVGSVQPLRLVRGGESTELRAAVRHMSTVKVEGGGRRYRAGLEFLNLTERATASINSLIAEQRQEGSQHEA